MQNLIILTLSFILVSFISYQIGVRSTVIEVKKADIDYFIKKAQEYPSRLLKIKGGFYQDAIVLEDGTQISLIKDPRSDGYIKEIITKKNKN